MKVVIRPMQEKDIAPGEAIYRQAFSAFLNIPDKHIPDFDYVRSRFCGHPEGAIAAEIDGQLVGTTFTARWGSLAVIGPSTVRPTGWTGMAGKMMLERARVIASEWGCPHVAGYTFSNSTRHLDFFQRVGLWPRFLTAIMSKTVRKGFGAEHQPLSAFPTDARAPVEDHCASLTAELLDGLDLREEFRSVLTQKLGDVVLRREGERLDGFAVCHIGTGSEAGNATCYVKFGAIRPGADGELRFGKLLDAAEAYAASRGMTRLTVGMNVAHSEAYRYLLGKGYLSTIVGVALHGDDHPLYKRPGLFVVDDWR